MMSVIESPQGHSILLMVQTGFEITEPTFLVIFDFIAV